MKTKRKRGRPRSAGRGELQYTIRGITPTLDQLLREKAQEQNRSLNDLVLSALRKETGVDTLLRYDDLDFMSGSWVRNPEAESVLAEHRQIRPEMWK